MKQYIILFLLLFSAYFSYSQSIDPDDYTFGTRVYVDSTLNIIPNLPSGVYIANISNKSGTYSYKFIVSPNK